MMNDLDSNRVDEKQGGELRVEHYSEDDVAAAMPTLRGKTLTFGLAFVAGTGFTLFG